MILPMEADKPVAEEAAKPQRPPHPQQVIDARTLFGSSNVVLIEFNGERYQLRLTRNGKLILTK